MWVGWSRAGLTSWSWFRSPARMERLARDSTAVMPYRLMRMFATRFKTICSSTMVCEHRGPRWRPITWDHPQTHTHTHRVHPQAYLCPSLSLTLCPGREGLILPFPTGVVEGWLMDTFCFPFIL